MTRAQNVHHHPALPGAQTQQAHRVRRVAQLRQVGDGAHRHHHEAQAGRRAVRRGLRGRLEEVQPHRRRQNAQGAFVSKMNGRHFIFVLFCCCLEKVLFFLEWADLFCSWI